MSDNTSLAKARGKARRFAMQAIYQWQMTGDNISSIEKQFVEENDPESFDMEYFTELLYGSTGDTSSQFGYDSNTTYDSSQETIPTEPPPGGEIPPVPIYTPENQGGNNND